jgi:hypothetical protein
LEKKLMKKWEKEKTEKRGGERKNWIEDVDRRMCKKREIESKIVKSWNINKDTFMGKVGGKYTVRKVVYLSKEMILACIRIAGSLLGNFYSQQTRNYFLRLLGILGKFN